MTPLTPVNIEGSALTAHGYDATSMTVALTFSDSPDTTHFLHVPQDVYDTFVAGIAACQDPTGELFGSAPPKIPEHLITQYLAVYYDKTTVTGAAAVDVEMLQDPTLPPAPSPAPAPAQS